MLLFILSPKVVIIASAHLYTLPMGRIPYHFMAMEELHVRTLQSSQAELAGVFDIKLLNREQ